MRASGALFIEILLISQFSLEHSTVFALKFPCVSKWSGVMIASAYDKPPTALGVYANIIRPD